MNPVATVSPSAIRLPEQSRGRYSAEDKAEIREFADRLRRVDSTIDFRMSARGWGYFLEGEDAITKAEIDVAEQWINYCRDKGYLAMDFVADDDGRTFDCVEDVPFTGPDDYLERMLQMLLQGSAFDISFWDGQNHYIQVLVEKVDLRELFRPICEEYNIPIANARGWSSKLQRARMAARWYAWRQRGNQPVLLYFGDYDPPGVRISDCLWDNFDFPEAKIPVEADWIEADYIQGYRPAHVNVHRIGLSEDQIEQQDMAWVNNLITGTGKNLANPAHGDHDKPYVQDWLRKVGERKVEANALMKEPAHGRQLFRDVVHSYLGESPKTEYQSELDRQRETIRQRLAEYDLLDPTLDTLVRLSDK